MGLLNFQSPLFEQNFTTYRFIKSVNIQAKETAFQEVILQQKYILKSAILYFMIKMIKKKVNFFLSKKDFFDKDFFKNRVRWNFNAVFGLEKTALDRIPRYRRTTLKEECL